MPLSTDRGVPGMALRVTAPGLAAAAGCAVDANARIGAAGGESIATRQAYEGI